MVVAAGMHAARNMGRNKRARSSKSSYRSVHAQVSTRLLHLAKCLLAENSTQAYNMATEIATLFLLRIPPGGYIAPDVFNFVVAVFHKTLENQNNSTQDSQGEGAEAAESEADADEMTKWQSAKPKLSQEHAAAFSMFLATAAHTTPSLRPLVLEHMIRTMAVDDACDVTALSREITGRCAQWKLEKHQVAKHYQWLARNIQYILQGSPYDEVPQHFGVELEHVLETYAKYKRLASDYLVDLYCQVFQDEPQRTLKLLNTFIDTFPNIYFLRRARVKIGDRIPHENRDIDQCTNAETRAQDLLVYAKGCCYSPASMRLVQGYKQTLGTKRYLALLIDAIFTALHRDDVWEMLNQEFDGTTLEETVNTFLGLFKDELQPYYNAFTSQGNISKMISQASSPIYTRVATLLRTFNSKEI